MSILYKLVENKVPGSKACGKWYARATPSGVKTIDDIADIMQQNCSLKRSDIYAALLEFSDTLESLLLDGYRVDIPRLGSFKPGVRSIGVSSPSEFNERKHLRKSTIHFKPSYVYDRDLCTHKLRMLQNVSYVDASKLASWKEMEGRKKGK